MRSEPSVVDIALGRWCTVPLPRSAALEAGRRIRTRSVGMIVPTGVLSLVLGRIGDCQEQAHSPSVADGMQGSSLPLSSSADVEQ